MFHIRKPLPYFSSLTRNERGETNEIKLTELVGNWQKERLHGDPMRSGRSPRLAALVVTEETERKKATEGRNGHIGRVRANFSEHAPPQLQHGYLRSRASFLKKQYRHTPSWETCIQGCFSSLSRSRRCLSGAVATGDKKIDQRLSATSSFHTAATSCCHVIKLAEKHQGPSLNKCLICWIALRWPPI